MEDDLGEDIAIEEPAEEESFAATEEIDFMDDDTEMDEIEPMEEEDFQVEPLEEEEFSMDSPVGENMEMDLDLEDELFDDEPYEDQSFDLEETSEMEVDLGEQPTYAMEEASSTHGESLMAKKLLYKLPHKLKVEVGESTLTGEEITSLRYGSIIEMDRKVGEPVDLILSGECIAQGEVVQINEDQLGVRITRINF